MQHEQIRSGALSNQKLWAGGRLCQEHGKEAGQERNGAKKLNRLMLGTQGRSFVVSEGVPRRENREGGRGVGERGSLAPGTNERDNPVPQA